MTEVWHRHTEPIVVEARGRGIEVAPIPELDTVHAVLEFEGHREFIATTGTDRNALVTTRILRHKAASLSILEKLGHPVADTLFTADATAAGEFMAHHGRVAVKPADLSLGIGVTVDISTNAGLTRATQLAAKHSNIRDGRVVVQKHLDGKDNRVLIVDGKHIFGIVRVPPFVVGDGERTIAELVGIWNDSLTMRYRRIQMGKRLLEYLEGKGWEPDDVPPDGDTVQLRALANTSVGGFSYDTTEVLCDEVIALAREIAAYFSAPIIGIDLISEDIRQTPGKIIEVNPTPGLLIHEAPTVGQARNVARCIVDMLFPETVVH